MKYPFQIQKNCDDTKFLAICIEDKPFDDFLNHFFLLMGYRSVRNCSV